MGSESATQVFSGSNALTLAFRKSEQEGVGAAPLRGPGRAGPRPRLSKASGSEVCAVLGHKALVCFQY